MAATFRIIPRTDWGAVHDRGDGPAPLPAKEVWAHHSVTIAPDLVAPFDDDNAAIRTLEKIGEQRFGRGISYTFAITPAGLIFEGHGVDRRGAHTKGRNSTARAIVFVGNYEASELTEAQKDAAAWLLFHGRRQGWWTQARFTGGHRQAPGSATACPGRHVMAALTDINARAARLETAGPAPAPSPAPAPPPPPPAPPAPADWTEEALMALPTLSRGANGQHVKILQGLLIVAASDLIDESDLDGDFGPKTETVLRTWQARTRALDADGVCGPKTWRWLIGA